MVGTSPVLVFPPLSHFALSYLSSLLSLNFKCTNSSGYVVATYNLKPPGEPAYRSSGNALTVYEAYSHLAIELLASLTIMRHVRQFNL